MLQLSNRVLAKRRGSLSLKIDEYLRRHHGTNSTEVPEARRDADDAEESGCAMSKFGHPVGQVDVAGEKREAKRRDREPSSRVVLIGVP